MNTACVLIGPAGAGKSSVGELLAARLGTPFADLDEVAAPYYAEVGWSLDRLRAVIGEVGRVEAERAWEPARVHGVRRVLADHPGAVIALGAGHTTIHDARLRADLADALRACPHVVWLQPDPDRDRALAILRARCEASKGTDWISEGHDLLAEWLDDDAARSLATAVVTDRGRGTAEVAKAVARILDRA